MKIRTAEEMRLRNTSEGEFESFVERLILKISEELEEAYKNPHGERTGIRVNMPYNVPEEFFKPVFEELKSRLFVYGYSLDFSSYGLKSTLSVKWA